MADKKISELASATALAGTEVLPVVQGGNTVKATAAQVAALAAAQIIDQGGAGPTHTGDTAEFTLKTIALPAGTLGANGQLLISALLSKSGTAGTYVVRVKFGGTTFHTLTVGATNVAYEVRLRIANLNATNSQAAVGGATGGIGTSTAKTTGAVDTTAAQNIVITVQNGNAGDTTALESWQVLAYPKA